MLEFTLRCLQLYTLLNVFFFDLKVMKILTFIRGFGILYLYVKETN